MGKIPSPSIKTEGIIGPYISTEDENLSPSTKCEVRDINGINSDRSLDRKNTPVLDNKVNVSKGSDALYGTEKTIANKPEQTTEKFEPSVTTIELKQELGLRNGVGVILGIMIGSGIFVSPSTVVQYCGSVGMSLIVWVISGLMAMAGALCFAELGTMIPKSGANYTYVLEAFGSIPAFLVLWISITIQRPAGRAIGAIIFATYLLQPLFATCEAPPYAAVRLLAAAMLCLAMYINCKGVQFGTRVQDTFSILKVLSLFVIIITGVYYLSQGNVENLKNPMKGTIYDVSSIATAFYSTLFTYTGWNSLNGLTGELKDANKNLPRAIAISLTIIIIFFTLTNVVYFVVLTPKEILSSSAVALTFGEKTIGIFTWVISLFVACATFGSANGETITQSRLMYVAAKEGHLPRFLSFVSVKNVTPVTSVISVVILPLLMLFVPDIGSLLIYTSFTRNLGDLLCVLALLWLRYKDPDRPRPIKVWLGFPIIYLALTLFVAIFPIVQRPMEIGAAVVILLLGLLVYYVAIHLQIKILRDAVDGVSYVCQMLLQCI